CGRATWRRRQARRDETGTGMFSLSRFPCGVFRAADGYPCAYSSRVPSYEPVTAYPASLVNSNRRSYVSPFLVTVMVPVRMHASPVYSLSAMRTYHVPLGKVGCP